jgi:hypothetical protein
LALNQENFDRWQRSRDVDRSMLLARVFVGNLLAFGKVVGLHIEDRLRAEVDLQPSGWEVLKPGVRLLGFTGVISTNFWLPALWGLGKSASRGFGTLQCEGD